GLTTEGTTVLLTTQYLEEADRLADRISVIDHGRVVADGRAADLKRRIGGQILQVRPTAHEDVPRVREILTDLTATEPTADADSGLLSVRGADTDLLSTMVDRMDAAGITATELALRLPSLDEVFLS